MVVVVVKKSLLFIVLSLSVLECLTQTGHTGSFSLAEGKLLRLPLTPHIRHIYRLEGKKSGLGSSVIRDGRFFIF